MGSESPKRPQQLARLDLAAEREKSAKFKAIQHDNAKKTVESSNNRNLTIAKKDTNALKQSTNMPMKKKAKIAVATEDQFNEIGEAAKEAAAAAKSKPAGTTKPRPASAGVSQTKPRTQPRPASAAPQPNSSLNKGSDSQRKLGYSPNEQSVEPNEDGEQKNEQAGEDQESEAKGLYGIFVQTRRCEKLCYDVGLKLKHIRKMKKKFDDNDMYHTGEITQAEFFYIINEDRRQLTKGILQYGGVTPDQKFMSFDEFLLCVVSFAVLTPPEVYQFAFDLYDADRSGTLDEYEFAKMSKEMQSKQFNFPKNTELAIKMIEGKDPTVAKRGATEDGLVDLGEFMKFAKLFPMAFFPLFNFQKNVRRSTLSQNKWSNLAARKLKIQELVSHMRRNYGTTPELSLGERLWSILDGEVTAIRKRASEIYSMELNQRRLIGEDGHDG